MNRRGQRGQVQERRHRRPARGVIRADASSSRPGPLARLPADGGHVRVPGRNVSQQNSLYIDRYIADVSATDTNARDADKDIENQNFLENSVIKLRKLGTSPTATVPEIEKLSAVIIEIITDQMDLQMPRKPALPAKPMSWWSDELKAMKEGVKELDFHKHKNKECYSAYQEAKNDFNKAIKASKEASWQNFCTKAESTKDISNLVKTIEGSNRLGRISILKANNRHVNTPEESLQVLLETHFEDHVEIE
jgi:hypothetical protein